ncbi:TIGR02452 family protein [Intrasporangium oryzae]|uniref:TIGR02452 family protein n=1 Tax=Intrasporangium oryzae TaxID=412687 RepID=UPI0012FB971F|nr:TIGR02452 family protein [Intrasporangium oryzae]
MTGGQVRWSEAIDHARRAKVSIPPEVELPVFQVVTSPGSVVEVTNEASLGAARRLTQQSLRPLVLNMANGLHPGGGYLAGAREQEEYLCRSTAPVATLEGDAMYQRHATRPEPDSTDWAILSPDAPVFRDDDGTPIEMPWPAAFLTAAAPYAPIVGQPRAGDLLDARIARVLDVANAHGYTELVLGAWGCGAFGNDPDRTANSFRRHLDDRAGSLQHVVFAVVGWSRDRRFLAPFARAFDA